MEPQSSSTTGLMIINLFLFFLFTSATVNSGSNLPKCDIDLLEFPLNLEYFEAEYFSFGSMGMGLDTIQPDLTAGGPPPVGAKKANLSSLVNDIITQFAYQEVGHLRAIKKMVEGFPRPLLNLSEESFATVMNDACGEDLSPPFDPYANDINYLISCYVIPYVGLTGYVGANPKLQSPLSRKLVAGLLGVESGQDAVIRSLLYERAKEKVSPYEMTVAEFTGKISGLRNKLGKNGVKDEGLVVSRDEGAEKKIEGNVLAGDEDSLAYGRTPREILRIVYGSGAEHVPGGFYPNGGDGAIAKGYLKRGR
ncbi:desiccation-related protein PCC13-62-like [Cynara cardunculus var. scolymus]|uniref:desiccation-related protein PCC13-62-like n=1 Tax=Cynara cardunculus var. scolymus TaxID=59895 RepID=UPI000D6238E8|nr:desiccation-related protein PCC13-62-like [Cynara cardunculus var. scolymus]